MDYVNTAHQIFNLIGGEKNIQTITHCMTRLRFVLVDESIVDDQKVKAIPGVLGVARQGGQYQIIIGNDVPLCFKEFMKLGNFASEQPKQKEQTKLTPKVLFNRIIDAISGSIAPILPVIIGCGMVRLLVSILGLVGVSSNLPTYQIITIIGDAGFYFLPIILAASAAKKFGCTPYLAMAMTAVLVHPDLLNILSKGNTTFLTIPVTAATYSSSVVPALLITWLLSKVEPIFDQYMKGWVKTIFKPMLILLIGVPFMLIVVAPLGAFAGNALAGAMEWMQTKCGWLTYTILAALCPLIVMTGMHYALVPTTLMNLGTVGYDTILGPMMLASNLAQASAAAIVGLKTKDKELKGIATASSMSAAVAGITEPALYGVTLRLKKPLIASMIGSGAAGLFAGIVGLRNYALVTPALVSIVQFISPDIPNNFIYAIITLIISVVVTAIMTLILGWDDPVSESMENIPSDIITSPIIGQLISLDQVNDQTFATGMLGDGVAIIPERGEVYAPCDGTISMIFHTKHAIGFTTDTGIELLIHVGLNTVELNGKGFDVVVQPNQKVKRGELLMRFDKDLFLKEGYDITTPIVVTNKPELQILNHSALANKQTQIMKGILKND